MKLLVYPSYKPSGVEWLGDVPEHWSTFALARLTTSRCDGPFGSGLKSEHYTESGIRVVRLNNIRLASFDGSDSAFIDPGYYAELGDHDVLPDDVLIAGLGDDGHPVGRACVAPRDLGPAMVKADCFRFRLAPRMAHPDFVSYQLSSTAEALAGAFASGTTRSRMNLSETARRPVALPPLDEQAGIAGFLDAQTAKLEALVAKKRALIEKLHDKRSALISRTVTRGLPPDAARAADLNPHPKLKQSRVEWLGAVPEHWEVAGLGRLAASGRRTFTDGDWIESPFITDEGVRLIQTGNIGIGTYREQGFRYISPETFQELRCTEVAPSDVLVCRLDGPVGRACLAPDLGVRMITSVDNAILKPAADVDPRYVVYTMTSSNWLDWFGTISRAGGGFRFRVSRSLLGETRFPKPPLSEQRAIATFLDRETAKIDTLVTKVEAVIERLQEYRAALITAAVTGKIDVRGAAPPAVVDSTPAGSAATPLA